MRVAKEDTGAFDCHAFESDGIGMVVCDPVYKRGPKLRVYGKVRIKTLGLKGEVCYMDVYAQGNAVKLMSAVCRRGWVIHLITVPGNKDLPDGSAKFINWLVEARVIERRDEEPLKQVDAVLDELKILDELDPIKILGADYSTLVKKGGSKK